MTLLSIQEGSMPMSVPWRCSCAAFWPLCVLQAVSARAEATTNKSARFTIHSSWRLLCHRLPLRLRERQGFSTNGLDGGMSAPRIQSKIVTDSEEFRARVEHNRALAHRLRADVAEAAKGGPEKHRERHVSRGKLLPRD